VDAVTRDGLGAGLGFLFDAPLEERVQVGEGEVLFLREAAEEIIIEREARILGVVEGFVDAGACCIRGLSSVRTLRDKRELSRRRAHRRWRDDRLLHRRMEAACG